MGLDLPRPPKGSFSWSAARSGHKDNEALALPALATMVCRITNGSALLPDVDGRSPWVRRCKDIVAAHLSDLSVARITPARPRAASSDALPAALPASAGGVHRGGVSLWPCSSRRQVTRHGRQPGGANASVGGLVWPSGLSRRPDWISALSGSFQ